jgi:hypothetical protein
MDALQIYALVLGVVLVGLIAQYLRMGRGMPWTSYEAPPAWIRAGIYFCACFLLAYFTGALELVLDSPIVTSEQLGDPAWWAFTAVAVGFICVAYGYVWVKYTVVFDRPRRPLMSALFGVLWGLSTGQLFLSVWVWSQEFSDARGWPVQVAWVGAWALISAWQPNWHSIYWDHYIAPEHDTPLTQRIKALGCHIPNLVITLMYVAVFDNYAIFIALQVAACTFAAVGMRFPAPWTRLSAQNFAPRTPYRVPRCTGYLSDDYTTDPWTPFHPGWVGPSAVTTSGR